MALHFFFWNTENINVNFFFFNNRHFFQMVIWIPKFSVLVVNESHNSTLLLKLESWTRIPWVVSSRSHFERGKHMVTTLLPASLWRSSLLHLRWHLCWLIKSLKTVQYLTPAEILAVTVQKNYEVELLHVLGKDPDGLCGPFATEFLLGFS